MVEVGRTGQPGDRQRRVVKGGSVVLVGIVPILSLFPQPAEFHGVDRFIVVHRPLIEMGTAHGQPQADDE